MTKQINETLEQFGSGRVPPNMKPYGDNYFGGCPHCGHTDGFMNVGRLLFLCDTHRTYRFIGEKRRAPEKR